MTKGKSSSPPFNPLFEYFMRTWLQSRPLGFISEAEVLSLALTSYDYNDLRTLILSSIFVWVVELNDHAVVSINHLLKTHHFYYLIHAILR